MPLPHIRAHIDEIRRLRTIYEVATPGQRFKIALDRINDPSAYPGDLVTRVSAVEAFARALLANYRARSKQAVIEKHRKLEKREAHNLVEDYTKLHGTSPKTLFGEDLWETFRLAVSARNLVVHECTFLDAPQYHPMANACTEILFGLVKLSKTRSQRIT